MTRPSILPVLVVAALVAACGSTPARRDVRRVELAELRAAGISGSASDEAGRLWGVAERERCLYQFDREQSDAPVAQRVALEGVPEDVDLESLAWIGPARLALGTERHEPRDADVILWAESANGAVRVTGALELSWRALYGIEAPSNQGIEGLCYAGGLLVAGGEPVVQRDDVRWAPVARLDLRNGESTRWEPFLLRLTSAEGKLSSLDCSLGEDGEALDVFAIERHFGVTRVLRFTLPLDGPGGELVPAVVADLGQLERMPNMEGLSRRQGRLLILTDHDSVTLEGTTETILLGPLDDDD